MKFVNPSFLFALFAVAIPIIIHLFNFRKYKTIYFTNVKFLKEIQQQTQAKSTLKHLLVLASRILALTALVFAFAQPFIPVETKIDTYSSSATSIFIDNSYSMNAIGETGNLIDIAKNFGIKIGNSFNPTDKFQLLTNDFEGKHQRLVNKEQFNDFIDNVGASANVKSLSQIIDRQKNALEETSESNNKIFIISDFQKEICDFDQLKNDSNISINLIPVQAKETNNVYIDSCWFETPIRQLNQQEKLHVVIVNTSDKNINEVPIKLFINGTQKAISSFSISAFETIDSVLYFTNTEAGLQQAKIEINDYPITYDDSFFLTFNVASYVEVLCLFDEDTNQNINSLFSKDDFISLKQFNINQLDYSQIPNQNFIILTGLKTISSGLAQELTSFINNGGSILVIPKNEIDLSAYNQFFNQLNANNFSKLDTSANKVQNINLEDFHYANVFENIPKNMNLPIVKQHFNIGSANCINKTTLLSLQNGDDLLSRYQINNGYLDQYTSPLNEKAGNMVSHSLMVPTFYKMAINSLSTDKLYYTIGENKIIDLKNTDSKNEILLKVKDSNSDYEFIPEIKNTNYGIEINVHDNIKDAGNYLILNNESFVNSIAFNYNRKESNLETYSPLEIEQKINDLGLSNIRLLEGNEDTISNTIAQINSGKQLWKYFIILALLFLGIETLLLKYWN